MMRTGAHITRESINWLKGTLRRIVELRPSRFRRSSLLGMVQHIFDFDEAEARQIMLAGGVDPEMSVEAFMGRTAVEPEPEAMMRATYYCRCGLTTHVGNACPPRCMRCSHCNGGLALPDQLHPDPLPHLIERAGRTYRRCRLCARTELEVIALNEPYESS